MQAEDAVRAWLEVVDGLRVGPALGFGPVGDRHRDDLLEFFELAHDDRPVRPGARRGNEEVIAAGLGLETAVAGRSRAPVRRDPMAKLGGLADIVSPGVARDSGVVVPLAINHETHERILLSPAARP